MQWFQRVRDELATSDPERVPFLGAGRAARAWRRTALLRSLTVFALGSAWDALTLTRMDRWSDQAFLAMYQVGFAILVVAQLRHAAGRWVPAPLERHPHLVHYGSQFLLGGLLSAFTIYYVRGAASERSALFVGLLIGLLIANEVVEAPLRVFWVRISLLAFCQFNGLLFALPLLSGRLPSVSATAALALVLAAGVLLLAPPRPRGPRPVDAAAALARGLLPAALTLAVVLGLIRAQVLPPLPLALHRVGVFHDVTPGPAGYALTWEAEPIVGRWIWRYDHVFHRQPGDSVSCFSAVFVPRGLALPIVHRWERYGPGGWVEVDRMTLEVAGGRTEGFRTYSRKEVLEAGSWRVLVELPDGRELGRVRFEVVDAPPDHPLVTETF